MGLLTFAPNVTLDGCCDHREGVVDDEVLRYWTRLMDSAGAMLFGRRTYELIANALPMSALGQKQTFGSIRLMSALPPKADIADSGLASVKCRKRQVSPAPAAPSASRPRSPRVQLDVRSTARIGRERRWQDLPSSRPSYSRFASFASAKSSPGARASSCSAIPLGVPVLIGEIIFAYFNFTLLGCFAQLFAMANRSDRSRPNNLRFLSGVSNDLLSHFFLFTEWTPIVALRFSCRPTCTSLYLRESVDEALRKIAFEEPLKIHDAVLEGIDLALRRRGYASIEGLKAGKKR
jgi:hypothetical protein